MRFLRKYLFAFLFSSLFISISWAAGENDAAVPRNVIGNLGGVKFSFPAGYVMFPEYDGEPTPWDGKKRATPVRTYDSSINSMSLRMEYPGFQLIKAYASSKNKIIDIGFTSGENFHDGGGVRRRFQYMNRDRDYQYEKSKSDISDLIYYKLIPGFVGEHTEEGRKRFFNDLRNRDIYINKSASSEIESYIMCGNHGAGRSRCRHHFNVLEIKTKLELRYPRELLQNWKLFEKEAVSKIFYFRVE